MFPMNELELKYHLKDLERRMRGWEAGALRPMTCGPCRWASGVLRRLGVLRIRHTAAPDVPERAFETAH